MITLKTAVIIRLLIWRARKKADGAKYRARHQEKIKSYRKAYYLGNLEKCKARTKNYRQEHLEKTKAYDKRYRQENTEGLKAYTKKYCRENAGKLKRYRSENSLSIKAREKKYRLENLTRVAEAKREWEKNNRGAINRRARVRRASDLNFRLRKNISTRLCDILRRAAQKKTSGLTMTLLGCTIPELRAHLERLFLPGMTWENHGQFGWHLDHKRPISSYNLIDPEQQKQCFHYSNLQPLWATDNLKKGGRYAAY